MVVLFPDEASVWNVRLYLYVFRLAELRSYILCWLIVQ